MRLIIAFVIIAEHGEAGMAIIDYADHLAIVPAARRVSSTINPSAIVTARCGRCAVYCETFSASLAANASKHACSRGDMARRAVWRSVRAS